MRFHADIARILMPADEPAAVRLLDEQRGAGGQNIPADHILDSIQKAAVMGDAVQHRQCQMCIVPAGPVQRIGPARLGLFDLGPNIRYFIG